MKKQVGEGIRARYDLKLVGERTVEQAVTEHPAFANARGMLTGRSIFRVYFEHVM